MYGNDILFKKKSKRIKAKLIVQEISFYLVKLYSLNTAVTLNQEII